MDRDRWVRLTLTYSYVYLEKSESNRVIKILKLLPSLFDWTPAGIVAKEIGEKLAAVISTLHKLAGAEIVDTTFDGRTQILAKRPFIAINKQKYNKKAGMVGYLRATIFIKRID